MSMPDFSSFKSTERDPNKTYKGDLWKAIRQKCLDCSTYSHKEVALCPVSDCPLYSYRFGKIHSPGKLQSILDHYRCSEDNDSEPE